MVTNWRFLSLEIFLSIIITACDFLNNGEGPDLGPCTYYLEISTIPVDSITMTSAISGGEYFIDCTGVKINTKGVFYSSDSLFPNHDTKIIEGGSEPGDFKSVLTGLTPNTEYYVRAYASFVCSASGTDSPHTKYGDVLSFKTLPVVPVVSTSVVSNFTSTTAEIGGNVSSEGLTVVTERGIYWGLYPDPDMTGTKIQVGNRAGLFSTTLSGLTPGITYYVKAYASNSVGSAMGEQVSFTTSMN